MQDKEYVIGALADTYTPAEDIAELSFKCECCDCKKQIWVMVHNLDKAAICINCVTKRMVSGKEEMRFGITEEDAKHTADYLRKRRKK